MMIQPHTLDMEVENMTVKHIEFEKVKVTIKYKSLPSAQDLSAACGTFLKRIEKEAKK